MRLATIATQDGSAAVVARGEDLVPVLDSETGRPFEDVGALLRADGGAGIESAREALTSDRDGERLGDRRLLRPILEPAGVFCVGLNYKSHIAEVGRETPKAPIWFDKIGRSLADPDGELEPPPFPAGYDYEGELAVVIGGGGRHIDAADAWEAIAGVTLFNDTGAREVQAERAQIFLGKNVESSTPFGPFVTTMDEIGRFEDLEFTLTVNDEFRQHGFASDLLFDVPTLIADISRFMRLEPGDVIATGTPSGIGLRFDPPKWLEPGDRIELSCPQVGVLRNTIGEVRR
jgi:acylpyruvate hydrolase